MTNEYPYYPKTRGAPEDPCNPRSAGWTTYCLYYNKINPNIKDVDGTFGIECPKTCHYADERIKKEH